MNEKRLDLIFGALADSTRRGMLADLAKGETNVKTLAQPYAMSQPAISKHLRVLEKADLITRVRRGRESIIQADPKTAAEARDWIDYYAQFWKAQFDDVEKYLRQRGDLE